MLTTRFGRTALGFSAGPGVTAGLASAGGTGLAVKVATRLLPDRFERVCEESRIVDVHSES
jgi:hypothetical protein